MLIILLYTYDEQARSEKDILEADNGYGAKNWERGRAEEKSDLAHEANIIGYRSAFFCDKVR
jgi:hypothetical protein